LTHPETAFRLLRDGRLAFSSPGDGSLYSAAFSVLPRETAESLVAIEPHDAKVSVSGYISRPRGARASRSLQYICVNGRFVKTRGIAAAAEEACRSLVMSGKHPAFIINVSLPCGDVDVNVHPAKTEVRFRNEREVTSAVYAAVRLALEAAASEFEPLSQNSAPAEFGSMSEEQLKSMQRGRILSESGELAGECEPQFAKSEIEKAKLFESDSVYELFLTENNKEKETYAVAQKATDYVTRASGVRDYLLDIERDSNVRCTERADDTRCENKREVETTHAQTRLEKAFDSATEDDEQPLMLRVIGEVLEVYIIAQCGRELVLIDKHAAHERLLFEKLREVIDGAGVDRQLLAEPVVVAVTVEEKQLLLDSRSELDCVGFVVDEFGEREVAVREIPTYLSIGCAADAVLELAAGLAGAGPLTTSAREWLLHSCACRAAIKAGHRSSNEELTALVRDVLAQKIPMHCPHGRPIFITFAEKELERRFGRVQ
ncbi:MAG: DNA mismatch repair endonuclease MutL, partial [Oscillospiraceae bacterium]